MKNVIMMFLVIYSFIYSIDRIDIWKRIAPSQSDGIDTLYLDMSTGYVWADEYYIYMVVYELTTNQTIALTFENGQIFTTKGGWWSDEMKNKIYNDNFNLDNYLKEMPQDKIEKKYK